MNIRTCVFWTFISENLQLPYKAWLRIGGNAVVYSKKKNEWVEISTLSNFHKE